MKRTTCTDPHDGLGRMPAFPRSSLTYYCTRRRAAQNTVSTKDVCGIMRFYILDAFAIHHISIHRLIYVVSFHSFRSFSLSVFDVLECKPSWFYDGNDRGTVSSHTGLCKIPVWYECVAHVASMLVMSTTRKPSARSCFSDSGAAIV
jgi:hypothetical protein